MKEIPWLAIAEAVCAHRYAVRTVKGRWPEGEFAIATDAYHSYHYAKNILKGRFKLGEAAIATDQYYQDLYNEFLDSL